MKPIRVLIADDHAMIREGLRQLLEVQADIEVVGEATDGAEALERCRTLRPDVALLDIAMPRMTGVESISLIKQASPNTEVVILSMYEKEAYVHQAIKAGALGYVLKAASSTHLLAAIRRANSGEFYLSPKVRNDVMESYLEGHREETKPKGGYELLSDRERQVFLLLVEGNTTNQISDILCVSPKTAEKHRANIIKKIGISQPVKMVQYAIRIGVVDPESWRT
jgi:two-component system response regulator NreC